MSVLNLKNKISKKWQEGKAEIKALEDEKKGLIDQSLELKSKIEGITERIIKIEAEFSILETLVGGDDLPEEKDEDSTQPYFGK